MTFRLAFCLLAASAWSACSPPPSPTTASATSQATQRPTFTPRPPIATPTATESVQAAPGTTQRPVCDEREGTVVVTELLAPELPRSLPYRIYLPPCAEHWAGGLPTLYLFHGLARTDSHWFDLGAHTVADRLIRRGVTDPFLMVMPWERLGLEYEPTIVEYLLPHVELEYGGSADPALRAVGGISRGAGWALRIGLGHGDLFRAVGLHSPAVLVPDLYHLPGWLAAGPTPALWIDIGDRDPLRFSSQALLAALDEQQVQYQFSGFSGEHSAEYWARHMEEYLRWYVSNWN